MIGRGEIADAKTIALLYFAKAAGLVARRAPGRAARGGPTRGEPRRTSASCAFKRS